MDTLEPRGECTYCLRVGPARNLRVLHERNKPGFITQYCRWCFPVVKSHVDETNERAVRAGFEEIYWFGDMGKGVKIVED